MNKFRLNLIVRTLILPFIQYDFLPRGEDPIECLAESFYWANHTKENLINQKIRREKDYLLAKERLEQFIQQDRKINAKSIDDVLLLVELFYSQEKIARCLGSVLENTKGEIEDIIAGYYISKLFQIANSLLTFRDGHIAIRTWINKADETRQKDLFDHHDTFNKVEIWNIIGRTMVPDIIIAAFFVECNLTDHAYLYNQNGNILLADKTLEKILQRGIAETHVHFNVGLTYTTLWKYVTNPFNWIRYFDKSINWNFQIDAAILFRAIIYRILYANYMEDQKNEKNETFFLEYCTEKYSMYLPNLCEMLTDHMDGKMSNSLESYQEFYYAFYKQIYPLNQKMQDTGDFLLETLYWQEKDLKTSGEMLFLTQALIRLRTVQDYKEHRLFLQYIRVKNVYFSNIIQGNELLGLDFFQKHFSTARRAEAFGIAISEEEIYKEILQSQSNNVNLKKLEIRITPAFEVASPKGMEAYESVKRNLKISLLKSVGVILKEYIHYCCNMANVQNSEQLLEGELQLLDSMFEREICGFPSIGIVFHFRKVDYLDNRLGDMCWVRYAKTSNAPPYSKHMLVWRNQMLNCAVALEELRSQIPYLGEYVVGIDAASNECNTEPWLLAPVYERIRTRTLTKPLLMTKEMQYIRLQNLGFTYHVGEEFRHILSGLRHIDEVLEHFQYKAGDRLGHAIALGQNINEWIQNNEVVVLPRMEYMENLLWLWGNIVYQKMRIPIMIEELEGRIIDAAKEIFGNAIGLNAFVLYEAYQEKFNFSHDFAFKECEKALIDAGQEENSQGHFCRLYNVASVKGKGYIWTKEKLLCTYYCPYHAIKFREPVFIPVSSDEGSIFKEIQAQMIAKVEKKGIYVETNPTSNTAISQQDSLLNHYILNLNSLGLKKSGDEHAVLVTVNSDDPVIFNTHVENELAYIYHALVHNGYEKEKILKWIDKVRQFGMDSCFVKKIKKPSEQIKQMQIILREIDSYISHGQRE